MTAFAALGVGYLLEAYKRHRDKCALAATFIAEISSAMRLFDELHLENRYRKLKTALMSAEASFASAETSTSAEALSFPVTVYEKCADRIGILGANPAGGIVRFYNFLSGFRVSVRIAVGTGPRMARIDTIEFMLDAIAMERPKVEDLLRKLHAIENQRFPWR